MGIENEIRQFMEDVEKIYHQTGMPLFPCVCCHLCLPCSPFCAMAYCSYRRISRFENLVKAFNAKNLEKGIFLVFRSQATTQYVRGGQIRPETILGMSSGLEVRMNVPKRKEYCTQHCIEFVMPETLPEPKPTLYTRRTS